MAERPFMEHPTGDFKNAVDAMADAISRLRSLPSRDAWITFCAQGSAGRPNAYSFHEVRVRGDEIDVDNPPLDVQRVCAAAGLSPASLSRTNSHYRIATLSPHETAQLFDSIFRLHYGLIPHADEHSDYAVGAEW